MDSEHITTRLVLDSFPDGAIVLFDHDYRYVAAGGQGLEGVGLSAEQLVGRTIWEAFPAETAASIEPSYRAALVEGKDSVSEVPYAGRVYTQHVAPVRDDDGEIIGGIVATQDVTALHRRTEDLQLAEAQFRAAFEHAPIGMALVELDGRFSQVNAALCEILDYAAEQLVERTFQDITHPDDLHMDLAHAERLATGEITSYRMEKRYYDARGRIVWVQLSGSAVRDADGRPVRFIAQIEDISERKRHEEQLTRLAQRDALTGLMNRAMFDRDLEGCERATAKYGDLCALLLIDLDGFKRVNDLGGHDTGDELLRGVAQAIRSRARISDHAYRIGGDEFAVLIPHATGDAATVLADALRAAIADVCVAHGGTELRVGASVGVATTGEGTAATLTAADRSMYAEKHAKRT